MTWIQGNQTHPSWPAPFYYHPLSLFNLFSVSLSFFYLHLVTQTWNVALTPLWFENNDRLLIHSTHVNVLWVLPEIPEGRMCKINWRVIDLSLFMLHLFISYALFVIVFWTASCLTLMLEIIIWSTQENHCCVSLFIGSADSVLSFSKYFHGFVAYFFYGISVYFSDCLW